MIEFPIPALSQGSDQSAIVTISEVIDAGFVIVSPTTSEYVMRVPGDPYKDDLDEAEEGAQQRFSQLMGVLRAFRHGRGEYSAETARAHARDDAGGIIVRLGTLKVYAVFPGQLEGFAARAATGLKTSNRFASALILFGSPKRDAGDFYKI